MPVYLLDYCTTDINLTLEDKISGKPKILKVLILEDSPADAELNCYELKSHLPEYNYNFEIVDNRKDFLNALNQFEPDLVLSDYNLPQYSGLDALKDMGDKISILPFIFVTGTLDEERVAETIISGAWDYVVKDRMFRLTVAVKNALELKEKRRISKSAEEENRRLAMVANTTTNIVIITDEKGRIQWTNPAFSKITGYEWTEVLGKTPGSVLQGAGSSKVMKVFMRENILKGKGFRNVEILNYRKNGTPYWAQIEVQPILGENGEVVQLVGIGSDITERKKAESELATREKRFSNLIGQSPMAIIEWDLNLKIIEWNNASSRLFGIPRDSAIDKTFMDLNINEKTNNGISGSLHEVMMSHAENKNIFEIFNGRHEKIYASWNNTPLVNEHGEITGVISMIENITDRITAERDLGFALQELENLHNNLKEAIFSVDTVNDKMLTVSIAHQDIYGFPPEDFFKNPHLWYECVLSEDRHIIDNENIQLSLGKSVTMEVRIRHANGSIRWLESKIQPTLDSNGKLVKVNGIAIDITRRKIAEEDLIRKNSELIKINEELDQFVYSVSHDLRAPIASLLGLIEVAKHEKDIKEINQLLQLQKNSLHRLDHFIHDIINYSRNARLDIKPEKIDFSRLIDWSLEELNYMENFSSIRKDINIHSKTDGFSDLHRLRVIVNNMVSNSIRYADLSKKDPFINVDIDISHDVIKMIFEDNGEGITKEYHDKIFEMFFRGSEKSAGSGIGLYIVKETVGRMNGEIDVKSSPKKGSKFTIIIPNEIE